MDFEVILEILDNCCEDKLGVQLLFKNKESKSLNIFPHKVVFIDGELFLIGEDISIRCLVSISLESLERAESVNVDYDLNFSKYEVDDLIMSIRFVSGNEERIILKIHDSEGIDLSPKYHFFGNPYLTTNSDGMIIWAGSVEVSEKLFDWIYNLGLKIEILDPSSFKYEYEMYKEKRVKKEAS